MRWALLLDTETSGLEPSEGAQCIEIAVMLYDIELASPIASFASLIRAESNGAEHINKITPDLIREAPFPEDVWPSVLAYAEQSDVIVAHCAEFDRKFVSEEVRDAKDWVCSKSDIAWPEDKRGDDLLHLALAYDLGVVSAHRAMADVDALSRIFTRIKQMGYSLEELLERAMRPKKRFVANVTYEEKDIAKKHGFAWDKPRKQWWRNMPPEDIYELPFRVRETP